MYGPYSLLQAEVKNLAKTQARRLNTVILSLIHPDQTGFKAGKSAALNRRRLFTNTQAIHADVGSRLMVSLDMTEAYNAIDWSFLHAAPAKFGFGPCSFTL